MAFVPTLEGSMILTDPQIIIGYTLKRYFTTPQYAVPLFGDAVISLPSRVAQFWQDPDSLEMNIRDDLQTCLNRIFNGERRVSVSVRYTTESNGDTTYTITIDFSRLDGEVNQMSSKLSLSSDGRIITPDSTLSF